MGQKYLIDSNVLIDYMADLIQGLNTISVCVEDTTKLLRVDNHTSPTTYHPK